MKPTNTLSLRLADSSVRKPYRFTLYANHELIGRNYVNMEDVSKAILALSGKQKILIQKTHTRTGKHSFTRIIKGGVQDV